MLFGTYAVLCLHWDWLDETVQSRKQQNIYNECENNNVKVMRNERKKNYGLKTHASEYVRTPKFLSIHVRVRTVQHMS